MLVEAGGNSADDGLSEKKLEEFAFAGSKKCMIRS